MIGGREATEPPVLGFTVEGVEALRAAAVPTLAFMVRIDAGGRAVSGIGLETRLQIRAERRRYNAAESERLGELFGAPDDLSRSLGTVPWAETTLHVGPFEGERLVEMRVPCTYDFEVAAAKYLAALEDGHVPVELLFSGNVLWRGADGRLQTAMIPWDREAPGRMPVDVWREALAAAFGDAAWLRVDRDVFARLQAERSRRRLTTWEDTFEALLGEADDRRAQGPAPQAARRPQEGAA